MKGRMQAGIAAVLSVMVAANCGSVFAAEDKGKSIGSATSGAGAGKIRKRKPALNPQPLPPGSHKGGGGGKEQ